MTRRMGFWLGVGLVVGPGCRKIDPVPEELDGIVHYVWDHLDEGTDEELAEAIDALHVAIDGDALAERVDGNISHLSADQIAAFGIDQDPGEATGVILTMPFVCGFPKLEAVFTHPDQDVLYPGVYDAYERSFSTSRDDYLADASDWLTWQTTYTTSALGASYTATSDITMRRIDVDAERPIAIARTVLGEPAVFDNPDTNSFFEQDYQFEIFWPRGDDVLHVYAMWRDNRLAGFEDEDEATQRVILNNLADWDENTEVKCGEELP